MYSRVQLYCMNGRGETPNKKIRVNIRLNFTFRIFIFLNQLLISQVTFSNITRFL